MTTLGLSIGTANLVAAPDRGAPTVRRSVVSLFPNRPPEVGAPQGGTPGLTISGFVERVGDPVPLVASDGSTHRAERLLAGALESMVRIASPHRPPEASVAAVPAHWPQHATDALSAAIATNPVLAAGGRPMPLVSDAEAALTALQTRPGLPTSGIVALVDLGATGTNITLADAASGLRPIGDTVRYDDFSGDLIDQAVLRHVLSGLDVDPSRTSAVESLNSLRDQCRIAKERLSSETATALAGPASPGQQSTVRLTRPELEALIRDPLDGLLAAIEEQLPRHRLAAVATVGGGASIPLVVQRLSEITRVPLVTWPSPALAAAFGAAVTAARPPAESPATSVGLAPAAATTVAPVVTATEAQPPAAALAANQLAWSEDQVHDDPPAGYQDSGHDPDTARPALHFDHDEDSALGLSAVMPWYRRPGVLFAASVCAVLVATAGLVLTWRATDVPTTPVVVTATSTPTTTAPTPTPTTTQPQRTVVEQQPIPRTTWRQQTPVPRTTVVTSTVVTTTTAETSGSNPDECTPPECIVDPGCGPDCPTDEEDGGTGTGTTGGTGDGGGGTGTGTTGGTGDEGGGTGTGTTGGTGDEGGGTGSGSTDGTSGGGQSQGGGDGGQSQNGGGIGTDFDVP